jgi:prepilin-type N-terminal cleavage/methylation domain-containing protein
VSLRGNKISGFTLLEMAIVMAITGTVTGVLFAASSVVQYKVNINKSVDVLGQINVNMHDAFAGRATSFAALAPPATPNFALFTQTFISQGIMPYDMLSPSATAGTTPCTGTIANNPWNSVEGTCGGAATGTILLSLVGSAGNPVQFVVRFTNIGADACADLLVRTSIPGRETSLQRIRKGVTGGTMTNIGIYGDSTRPLPISTIAASTACPTGSNYDIDWYFNLNG